MKKWPLVILILLLIGSMTACTDKPDESVLPEVGLQALDLEIRHGNLTQFEAPYSISSVQIADGDKVLDIYDQYFCITVTPPIPRTEYSSTTYRHYIVVRENSTWRASTEDSSAFIEWERIGCSNWDD